MEEKQKKYIRKGESQSLISELTVRCTTCNHINTHSELIKGVQCSQCRTNLSKELF